MLPHGRQAVVLIHGIGEQKPMATIRSFVDSVLEADEGIEHYERKGDGPKKRVAYYSRPDRISGNFELRCLRSAGGRIKTDFYELYWAHRMKEHTSSSRSTSSSSA